MCWWNTDAPVGNNAGKINQNLYVLPYPTSPHQHARTVKLTTPRSIVILSKYICTRCLLAYLSKQSINILHLWGFFFNMNAASCNKVKMVIFSIKVMVFDLGVIWKGIINRKFMPNTKYLYLTVQKLCPRLKILSPQSNKQTGQN